ncbi:unnamed protein product, partial [Iphiclides podalirius]
MDCAYYLIPQCCNEGGILAHTGPINNNAHITRRVIIYAHGRDGLSHKSHYAIRRQRGHAQIGTYDSPFRY